VLCLRRKKHIRRGGEELGFPASLHRETLVVN